MSTFTLNSITVKGLNVIAKLVAGSTLEFTRIAIGDGAMPSDKTPLTVTDLAHRLFDVTINSVESDGTGSATVTGVFSNKDKETGFFYRELGLYAKDPDTQAEFLYCYGNAAADAEWISPSGASSVIEKEVKIVTLVGNAENVTANIPSGIYPTKEEMQKALAVKADLDARASEGGRVLASQMRFDEEQTLYVDAAATAEGANGSEEKPYKTIQAAVNAFYPGARVVTIKIKAGTYPEAVNITNAAGVLFLLARNGSGTVTVKSINAQFTDIHISDITVTGGDSGNAITIANVGNGTLDRVTVNGNSAISGVALYNARCFINSVTVNNCETAIEARDGTFAAIRGTAGTGNGVGLAAFESIITCAEHTMTATTPYVRQNGGAINAESGAASFPSNYSQRLNLGDFSDAAALKSAILAEMGRLGIGESRECWFACNITAGFGPFEGGQRMTCTIIKSTNSGSGYGLVLFYSHHNVPAAYMQIQDGAFVQPSPTKFADANDMGMKANWIIVQNQETDLENLATGFYSIQIAASGITSLPEETNGFLLVERNIGVPFQIYITDTTNTIYKRNYAYDAWQPWEKLSPSVATTEVYGLVKLASEADELNPKAAGAALAPANVFKLCNFRLINHAYSEGDVVACAYHADLQLKCTKAGTTSGETLDTSDAEAGQVIQDGTCQWTVWKQIRSINNAVADSNGNVTISTVTLKVWE